MLAGSDVTPITWIIPYYRNAPMLEVHVECWATYSDEVRSHLQIVLVDDCSPVDDRPDRILQGQPVRLLRILDDIPWNWIGARNLGAKLYQGWLLMTDMDRIMLDCDLRALMTYPLRPDRYYKPIGIRMNSRLPIQDIPKGPYNQFLVHHNTYWAAGGYDEDYSGCLYGDKQFFDALNRHATCERITAARMYRYDEDVIEGSTTRGLDRSYDEGRRRFREKTRRGDLVPQNHIRFRWEEVAL